MVACLNGTAIGTKDTSANYPASAFTKLQIGALGTTPSTSAFTGYIKELVLKQMAASDATIIDTPDNWAT